MATRSELKTSEILSKLTTGILGAKTFQNTPKWEVEGGPIPRTFFTDRLNNNADKPINDEAVLWLVRLYNAQLGIFKMRKPIDEAKSVKISNELVAYLSEITGIDLLKLKNSYNDSDSAAKRKGLVDVLASVLNSSIDKEYFDPALVASDISNILRNLILGGDFTASLKTACVSEVSGKCPFCNHELVSEDGDEVVESYKIIKFPAPGHVERFEYLAVCNNCYERYKDITKVDLLQRLQDKKKVIVARKSFEKSVDALEMEKEIVQVLDALTVTKPADMPKLQYSPVEVQDKIPDDNMLCSKILTNVVQYFPFVEEKLKELNNERKLTYEKISGDVKRAYLEFASNEDRKEVIFNQLCEWLAEKAQTDKKSACEVIISYYVQNCEVFERETT